MVSQATLDRIVSTIVEGLEPRKIILFGSQARDDAGPGSDVDLLIVADMAETPPRRAARVYSLFDPHPCSMDVMVYTPEEVERYRNWTSLALHRALSEGTVLYER